MDMGIGRASIMVMVMVRGRDWTSISYKREIPQSTLPSAGQPDTAGRRWHPTLHTTPCHRLRILPGWDGSHPLARSAARAHRPSCATLRLLQSTKEEGLLHCTELRPPPILLQMPTVLLSSQQRWVKIMMIYIKLSEPLLHTISISLGQYLRFYCCFLKSEIFKQGSAVNVNDCKTILFPSSKTSAVVSEAINYLIVIQYFCIFHFSCSFSRAGNTTMKGKATENRAF